ncbi:MAG: hypothetical protein ACKV19_24910 [Verrucomicrobiales bacterium]
MSNPLPCVRICPLLGVVVGWCLSVESVGAAAVLLPGESVLTPGSPNPGGTVEADMTTAFEGEGGLFNGVLRALAVRAPEGTMDFYYQVTNLTADPTEFIDGLVAANFTNFNIAAGWSTNGLAGISGAGIFEFGTTPPEMATLDLSPPDDVAFFFELGSLDSSSQQNPSAFLIVRTDAIDFGPGHVIISGAGLTTPIPAFAPAVIPEPSPAALFFAAFSFWTLQRRRPSRPRHGTPDGTGLYTGLGCTRNGMSLQSEGPYL